MRRTSAWAAVFVATLLASVWLAGDGTAAGPREAADVAPAAGLPQPDLAYGARQGRQLFAHYCSTCHGPEGGGDGFNAYSLDPRPRDLSQAAFQSERTDTDLAAVIRSGGGVLGLSTNMPPWGHTLNDRQISYLVQYLRTLAAPAEAAAE